MSTHDDVHMQPLGTFSQRGPGPTRLRRAKHKRDPGRRLRNPILAADRDGHWHSARARVERCCAALATRSVLSPPAKRLCPKARLRMSPCLPRRIRHESRYDRSMPSAAHEAANDEGQEVAPHAWDPASPDREIPHRRCRRCRSEKAARRRYRGVLWPVPAPGAHLFNFVAPLQEQADTILNYFGCCSGSSSTCRRPW